MNRRCFQTGLLLWLVCALRPGLAQDFPSRPTLSEMNQMIILGTRYGHAVQDRSLAIKSNWSVLPNAGIRANYIAALQQRLEALAPAYINHRDGPLTAAKDAFVYYTLLTWRSAVSLNAEGFRRYDQNRSLAGYGIAQPQDVITESVLDEVAAGLGVLEWTSVIGLSTYGTLTGTDYFFSEGCGQTNWSESTALTEANYGINKYAPFTLIGLGEIEAWYASTWGLMGCYRTTIKRTTTAGLILQDWSPSIIERLSLVRLYLKAGKYAGAEIGEHNSVFDNNGLGDLTENGTWDVAATEPGPFYAGEEAELINNFDIPARCENPYGRNPPGSWRGFYTIDSPTVLLQWNFVD